MPTRMGVKETHICSERTGSIEIPQEFLCPLSLKLMVDPVIVASGQTFERACIEDWFAQGNSTCPKTREPLEHLSLIPNYTVKALICNWAEDNGVCPLAAQVPSSRTVAKAGSAGFRSSSRIVGRADPHRKVCRPPPKSLRCIFPKHLRPSELLTKADETGDANTLRNKEVSESSSCSKGGIEDRNFEENHLCDSGNERMQKHQRNGSLPGVSSRLDDSQVWGDGFSHCTDASCEPESMAAAGSTPWELGSSGSWHVRAYERPSLIRKRPTSMPKKASSTVPALHDLRLVIEQLVAGLQTDNIEVQRKAAAELRLLAKFTMENRIAIASAGAVGPLVELLQSTDSQTQEHAVTALLNLSINNENKAAIAAAGAIAPLVRVLTDGSSQARENAAFTLFSLSVVDENKMEIGAAGAISHLVELLAQGSLRGKKDAATALFSLSSFHENKTKIVRAGAVRLLVDLMADQSSGMVDKAVAILSVLVTAPEGRVAVAEHGGIPVLVEMIELGSPRGKEFSVAVLLQLCINNDKHRAMVLQEGAIPPLVALSQSGNPRAKEKASTLLCHLREQRFASLGVQHARAMYVDQCLSEI